MTDTHTETNKVTRTDRKGCGRGRSRLPVTDGSADDTGEQSSCHVDGGHEIDHPAPTADQVPLSANKTVL